MDGRTLTPLATPQRVHSGLGTRLRQLRVSAGLTQSDLAGDRFPVKDASRHGAESYLRRSLSDGSGADP